jgi:hypothetical protein
MKNFYDHCDRCDECGKFVSYKDPMISYTRYGSVTSTEPPDPDHICMKCWNKRSRILTDKISWIKPHVIRVKSQAG